MQDLAPAFRPAAPFLSPAAVVSEGTALGLAPFWRGITLVANSVAQMAPCGLFIGDEQQATPDVVRRPSPNYDIDEFWFAATATLIMHGDYIAIKERDGDGNLVALHPVHPSYVNMWSLGTELAYMVYDKTYRRDDVFHVRGVSLAGALRGIGVLEAHRRGIGLALDTLQFSSGQFRGSGVPSVALKVSKEVSEESLDDLMKRWAEKYADAARVPAALPPYVDVVPLGAQSPEDMEALASRSYSAAEVAMMLGLDPTDLGVSAAVNGGAITYANLSERTRTRFADAVLPWIRRFEQALTEEFPGPAEVRFQRENLTRLNERERAEVDEILIRSGVKTINEIRAERGLSEIGEP